MQTNIKKHISKERKKVTMKRRLISLLLVLTMLASFAVGCKKKDADGPVGPVFNLAYEEIETFSNHVEVPGGDKVGDPFVMRYDGKYYLYPSATSNEPWYVYVSEDLVNWSEKIECVPKSNIPSGINEHGKYCESLPAYAPEVTYFNGKFIMVTSLGGTGHQFFVADSPTGPFKRVGEQCGWKIDGHIFIDNDGKWYFYSAHGSGIKVCDMPSPTSIGNEIGTLSQINKKWTEGPMVVYHDGVYYMTYTGNHVSNISYRIPYSVSTKTPYEFSAPDNNLLMISTIGEIAATGHSSTVKGPDLDSYYMVYHSHTGESRVMNIDRIIFDGETMDVMGPTSEYQPVPSMPDIYAHFEVDDDFYIFEDPTGMTMSDGRINLENGGMYVSKDALAGNKYTIEATTANISDGAKAGVVFGYSDGNNYGKAVFDTSSEKLVVTFILDGKATVYEKALVRSFDMPYDFDVLQALQVEKNGNEFTFYVNDREIAKYESTLSGSKVGLVCENGRASFGYLGASDEFGGSSNCEFYKPVGKDSGMIPAHLCLEEDCINVGKDSDQSKYVVATEDSSFNYRIYNAADGIYTFALKYRSESDALAEIYVNGALAKTLSLASTGGKYATVSTSSLYFNEGKNVITVYMKTGSADLKQFTTLLTAGGDMTLDFSSKDAFRGLVHKDGIGWSLDGNSLYGSSIGKRTYGNTAWADYTYECDVTLESTVDCGILVRTKNAADSNLFEFGNYPGNIEYTTQPSMEGSTVGADWMQGYFIHMTANKLTLKKCNYSSEDLDWVSYCFDPNESYHLGVACIGADIMVYVNGELLISYNDPDPFLTGAVGVRLVSGTAYFDNISVKIKEN